jgi:hypothetical protein
MSKIAYVILLKTGEQLRGNDILTEETWVTLFQEKGKQKPTHNIPVHNISYIMTEEVMG